MFGIKTCSFMDWFFYGVFVVSIIIVQIFSAKYIKHIFERKLLCGYKFLVGDIHWTNSRILRMILIALFAGSMSSMVGLGGGVIFNPIFLGFSMPPKVAFATGMYLAIFISLANTILYALAL